MSTTASQSNVGKTIINHHLFITNFIRGMFTIPSHGWFIVLPTLRQIVVVHYIVITINTIHYIVCITIHVYCYTILFILFIVVVADHRGLVKDDDLTAFCRESPT